VFFSPPKAIIGSIELKNEKAPRYTSIAFQPKNSTATQKRTGYRAMYKTDTHSDIIFWYLGQAHNLMGRF